MDARHGAWTPAEDKLLADYQAVHGNRWSLVAQHIPGRTGQQCAQRWRHKVNPDIRKEKWSADEDAKLAELVAEHGNKWAEIAKHIPGRTDQQCMGRWRRHLDPGIRKCLWQPSEDAMLTSMYTAMGPQWSNISRCLEGRTAQQCRARWFQLCPSDAAAAAAAAGNPRNALGKRERSGDMSSIRANARLLLTQMQSDSGVATTSLGGSGAPSESGAAASGSDQVASADRVRSGRRGASSADRLLSAGDLAGAPAKEGRTQRACARARAWSVPSSGGLADEVHSPAVNVATRWPVKDDDGSDGRAVRGASARPRRSSARAAARGDAATGSEGEETPEAAPRRRTPVRVGGVAGKQRRGVDAACTPPHASPEHGGHARSPRDDARGSPLRSAAGRSAHPKSSSVAGDVAGSKWGDCAPRALPAAGDRGSHGGATEHEELAELQRTPRSDSAIRGHPCDWLWPRKSHRTAPQKQREALLRTSVERVPTSRSDFVRTPSDAGAAAPTAAGAAAAVATSAATAAVTAGPATARRGTAELLAANALMQLAGGAPSAPSTPKADRGRDDAAQQPGNERRAAAGGDAEPAKGGTAAADGGVAGVLQTPSPATRRQRRRGDALAGDDMLAVHTPALVGDTAFQSPLPHMSIATMTPSSRRLFQNLQRPGPEAELGAMFATPRALFSTPGGAKTPGARPASPLGSLAGGRPVKRSAAATPTDGVPGVELWYGAGADGARGTAARRLSFPTSPEDAALAVKPGIDDVLPPPPKLCFGLASPLKRACTRSPGKAECPIFIRTPGQACQSSEGGVQRGAAAPADATILASHAAQPLAPRRTEAAVGPGCHAGAAQRAAEPVADEAPQALDAAAHVARAASAATATASTGGASSDDLVRVMESGSLEASKVAECGSPVRSGSAPPVKAEPKRVPAAPSPDSAVSSEGMSLHSAGENDSMSTQRPNDAAPQGAVRRPMLFVGQSGAPLSASDAKEAVTTPPSKGSSRTSECAASLKIRSRLECMLNSMFESDG